MEIKEDMEEIDTGGEFVYQLQENLEHLDHILTPVQYVSIILTDAFLYKGKEAAHIIGTTEVAVHAHVSRARKSLRKCHPGSDSKSGKSPSAFSLQGGIPWRIGMRLSRGNKPLSESTVCYGALR
ncbi:hypothetical protein RKD55_003134 [Rossellomorea marisflavi]